MKLGIENGVIHNRYGDEKGLRMIKEAGFDGVDYSFCVDKEDNELLDDHYVEYAHKVKGLLAENDLICYQTHAPFSMSYGLAFDESVEGYRKILRAMESASILGSKYIVVHALKVPEGVDDITYNLGYFKSFEPYCEKFGIHIAIENIHKHHPKRKSAIGRYNTPEVLYKVLNELASPWYVVCVDVGHAAISGPEPEELIRGLDNKVLRCLHIHDNNYQQDNHGLPYTGDLNWNNITEALKSIRYEGVFSLEVTSYLRRFDDETIMDALWFAEKIGRYLANRIDS